MTETQERFLKVVAERVPLERVAEVYLFPAIRQGGVETGLAVVAAERWADDLPAAADSPGAAHVAEVTTTATGGGGERNGETGGAAESGAFEAPMVEGGDGAPVAGARAGGDLLPPRGEGAPPQLHDRLADVGDRHHANAPRIDSPPAAAPRDLPARHTIFSARYRLALKGPDRGKWEVDVVAEADAPLVTVDAIVRGIRKRTGEAADAERVSPDVLRELTAHPA